MTPRPGRRQPPAPASVRSAYIAEGVVGYYRAHGATYRNPHEAAVAACVAELLRRDPPGPGLILDLACGSGEVTLALRAAGAREIAAADPYTQAAYVARVGQAAERLGFEQIAAGALSGRQYALVVCSFALHLIAASRLPGVLTQLALVSPRLWIISPHKRPVIRPEWGWRLREDVVIDRVRARAFGAT